jgi:ribonuclease P protein component
MAISPDSGPPLAASAPIARLKKRADFLAAARALTCARGAVVTQARRRGDGDPLIRIGFTATRRIGGAVVRNRAKRRLREAARLLAPAHARPGCDYVLIARSGTASRPWPALLDDVKSALLRLAADLGAGQGEPESPAPRVAAPPSPAQPETPSPSP